MNAVETAPDTVRCGQVKEELARICNAPQFNRSPVMRSLLHYLVEKSLAGEGGRLKAYTIAVDALGRDEDFDTRTNSYPRVQVGRLRQLLDDFYAENPIVNNLRFAIAKGGYIVSFTAEGEEPSEIVRTIVVPEWVGRFLAALWPARSRDAPTAG